MILGSIILAGGRSRRMGQPKESLAFGGTTLLGQTVDTLLACSFPVVVVARDEEQELPPITLEAHVVFDKETDQGPLIGLCAGLRFLADECDAAFVTGCDAPFLTAAAVDWLAAQLGDHDLVMARVDDVLQPLGAVYRVSLLPTVLRLIAAGVHTPRSLAEEGKARILTEADVDGFDPERGFLQNINSPEDYAAALARAEASGRG